MWCVLCGAFACSPQSGASCFIALRLLLLQTLCSKFKSCLSVAWLHLVVPRTVVIPLFFLSLKPLPFRSFGFCSSNLGCKMLHRGAVQNENSSSISLLLLHLSAAQPLVISLPFSYPFFSFLHLLHSARPRRCATCPRCFTLLKRLSCIQSTRSTMPSKLNSQCGTQPCCSEA